MTGPWSRRRNRTGPSVRLPALSEEVSRGPSPHPCEKGLGEVLIIAATGVEPLV